MTLGKDVPGASLNFSKYEGAEICKSGTSVATPIAAGIAAMLLGYARVNETSLQNILRLLGKAKLSRLWGIDKMSEVLEEISTEMIYKWPYLNIYRFTDESNKMRQSLIAVALRRATG